MWWALVLVLAMAWFSAFAVVNAYVLVTGQFPANDLCKAEAPGL